MGRVTDRGKGLNKVTSLNYTGLGIRSPGFGALGSGFGIRDSGFGIRDRGLGMRDEGLTRSQFYLHPEFHDPFGRDSEE
jgi:hypothetical protein